MACYLATSKKILQTKGVVKELELLKILASEVWRLDFLEEAHLGNLNELNAKLLGLYESFTTSNLDGFDLKLKSAEDMLIVYYLKPLDLADRQIDNLLQIHYRSLSVRISKILGEALWIKSFSSSSTTTCRNAYDQLLQFCNLYGFKTTYYLHSLILSNLQAGKYSASEFVQKIKNVDQRYEEIFNLEDISSENSEKKISLEDLIQKTLNFLKRNPNFGRPYEITLDIMNCLLEREFDPKPLIQVIIDEIFFSIVTIFHHSEINALVYSFDKNIKSLRESALYLRDMAMEIIVPGGEKSEFIKPGQKFVISPIGITDSPRFRMDRITLFGRFTNNPFGNDVFVDKNFDDFSKSHFMIISAEDGYFITDMSTSKPISKKFLGNETTEIKVGMVICLGPRYWLMVKEILTLENNDIKVIFQGVSKSYYRDSKQLSDKYIAIVKINGQETCIGRELKDGGMMIREEKQEYNGKPNLLLVSRIHSYLKFENGKILIRNSGALGTYIYLKSYWEYLQDSPSEFFRIENGQCYYSNDFTFKFEIS